MKIKANGIEMHYTLDGPANAPVVTLSHSLATDLSMWDPQLEALSRRYRVLRYDTRGHGGTEVTTGAYSLDLLAEDARQLLAALGIARTHWIGLSMGGMIGQTLALKAPDIFLSLSLCDTSSRMPAESKSLWDERIKTASEKGMAPLLESTLARWFTQSYRDRGGPILEHVKKMILETPPAGFSGCCAAIAPLNLTDRIGAIRVPTLVLVGEDDPGTPVPASRAIHEQIKGSELVILKSAAHLSNLEQPEAFTRALLAFLDRVD